jgi:hypothetical protein
MNLFKKMMGNSSKPQLSDVNRDALMINIHDRIVTYANHTANDIQHGRLNQLITYPPDGGLTNAEKEELAKLSENEVLKCALRKVIASNTADVFFDFFNMIDGTSDPELSSSNWTGAILVDFDESYEPTSMLHDEFYSTYHDWKAAKGDINWQLDLQK